MRAALLLTLVGLLLSVALLLAGCDNADPVEPDPVISGTYTGAYDQDGTAVDVTLNVTQDADSTLSGTVIFDVGIPLGLTVSGTHRYPDFTMRFTSSAFDDIVYSGMTSSTGTLLNGEMNGSGYANEDLTLAK